MADQVICDKIVAALQQGPITVDTHGELRRKTGIGGSSSQFKRALGSLIGAGTVHRHRPEMEGCTDTLHPITFKLGGY